MTVVLICSFAKTRATNEPTPPLTTAGRPNLSNQVKVLEKVKKIIGCGAVSVAANQARVSVQKIDDVVDCIIPFFTKNKLTDKKKKDFELWRKAVLIIFDNKGIYLSQWKKNDLMHLMEIHKAMARHKQKPRSGKWMEMAKTLAKTT